MNNNYRHIKKIKGRANIKRRKRNKKSWLNKKSKVPDVEKGELGLPLGSKFNNIKYLNDVMKCLMVPKSHICLQYRLIKDVHDVLVDNGIEYFGDGGTLLGAIRGGGLIPWDDDLDIGIMLSSYEKTKKAIQKLTDKGYHITEYPSVKMMKVYISNKWIVSPLKYSANPTLDIFTYKKKKGIIRLASDLQYNKWPSAVYNAKKHYPLVLRSFGPFKIYFSGDGLGYCDKLYSDWRKCAVVELRGPPSTCLTEASKADVVKLPMGFISIFIPNYNVTVDEIEEVVINDESVNPMD